MHSRLRWSAWYICIDRLPWHELERKYQDWNLKAFLAQPLVIHIQRDLGNLTPQKLELWCKAFTNGCTVGDVVALHASFDCTTLSRAGACNDTENRTASGGAVSLAAQYDSQHHKQQCTTVLFGMSALYCTSSVGECGEPVVRSLQGALSGARDDRGQGLLSVLY